MPFLSGTHLRAHEFNLQTVNNLREFAIAPHGAASARPVMPAIPLRLVSDVDLAGTSVRWEAQVAYSTRERHPMHLFDYFQVMAWGDLCPPDLFQHRLVPDHPDPGGSQESIRGGRFLVSVVADLPSAQGPVPNSEYLDDIQVRLGEQPDPARIVERLMLGDEILPDGTQVSGAMLTRWIRAIARRESRLRQNAASQDPAHFQVLGEPLMSRSGDGGIGIMQRTPRGLERVTGQVQIQDWLWNWQTNVDEGLRLFRQDKLRAMAYRYPGEVERGSGFARAVEATNQHREAAGLPRLDRIRVPPFHAEQMVLDAVRGYNGYAGKDPFGRALHEFRLRTHATEFGTTLATTREGLDPDQPDLLVAWAEWEAVPASDRPQAVGDPDYVAHVRTHLDQP